MAYKFQVGPAILSGSTTYEDAISAASVTSVGASSAATLSASAGISGGSLDIGGNADIDGELDVGGLFKMADVDAGKLLIADGTSYVASTMSGDVAIASGGLTTIQAGAVHGSMLNTDAISGQSVEMTGDLADTDELMVSDGGVLKRADFSVVRDAVFADVSGDATIAAGGALTIAAQAVENSMLADDAVGADELASNAVVNASVVDGALKADKLDIDGSTDIGADLVDADLFIVDDGAGGTNRKSTLTRVKKYVYSAVSGDATVSDSGALTIAASAVEGSMLNSNVAGLGLHLSASAVHLSASVAGDGLSYAAGVLAFDMDEFAALGGTGVAQGDHFIFSDDGTEKRITFSNLEDAIFGNVSGDATIAAGGALTIAAQAVENSMLADDAVGADELAADAVVNASVVDGALKADKLDLDGSTDIGADLADADLLIVDDGAGGTNRVAALSRMKKYVYSALSGDATASDTGALTIAASAVEGSMLNSNVVADTLQLSGSALRLSSSVAGAGIAFSSGVLSLDIDELLPLGSAAVHQTEDHFAFSDNGTEKKITFSNLQDAVFADVSGDATVAAGGALTIADGAVEHGMLAENIISGQAANTSPADADVMMIGDSSTVKKITLANLQTYFAGGAPSPRGDADVTLTEGVNFGSTAITQNRTWTLPASPAEGDKVIVKAAAVNSGVYITIAPDSGGTHTIDDGSPVRLQEDFAAATLVYVGMNQWFLL